MCVLSRGLSAPEAELHYMQEVEKTEGYAEESIQAKVNTSFIFVWCETPHGSQREIVTRHIHMSVSFKIRNWCDTAV